MTEATTVGRVAEDLAVRIRPGVDPAAEWVIRGELVVPAGGAAGVQVLLPGLTYDRRYWQVPGDQDYVEFMLRAGHAVLAVDRLGTGQSSRPPAHQVTVDSHVEAIHQLVQRVRPAFDRVVVVGHGFGAGLAVVEAARHADVDALVLTGLLHPGVPTYEEVVGPLHPAAQDPILGDPDVPEAYLTQPPGLRARLFEYAGGIDRQLAAHDELIKSTATTGEAASLAQVAERRHAAAVRCPVLLMVGEHDPALRGRDVALERDWYGPAAELTTHVVAGTGHALNLHRTAPAGYRLIQHWLAA